MIDIQASDMNEVALRDELVNARAALAAAVRLIARADLDVADSLGLIVLASDIAGKADTVFNILDPDSAYRRALR